MSFSYLDLSNAFLFAAALEDPETCKLILELILGKPLPDVNVRVEHSRWREQYMTFDELLRESKKEGHEAGLAEGRKAGLAEGEQQMQRMLCLISKMIENSEADAVSRLSEDPDFLSQMYEKYHI